MSGPDEKIVREFRALRASLKDASIEALQQDRYEMSRRLTELMEALTPLESQATALLAGKKTPVEAVEKSTPPSARRASSKAKKYPRFYRIGDTLYKEGMRQDGKSIYTQKVGRPAFEEIATAVAARKTRKFKPADVIGKVEQPSYQVYIVLNVLQDAGLVENPERGSYRVSKEAANTDVSALWGNIRTEAA